jgi:hypothetical protein
VVFWSFHYTRTSESGGTLDRGQVFVADALGKSLIEITDSTIPEGMSPSWSSDGNKILFVGGGNTFGSRRIILCNADGSDKFPVPGITWVDNAAYRPALKLPTVDTGTPMPIIQPTFPPTSTSSPTATSTSTRTSTLTATPTPRPTLVSKFTSSPTATSTNTRVPTPTVTVKVTPSATPKASQPMGPVTWSKLPDTSGLPDRGSRAVYNSKRQVIVLFGGTNSAGQTLSTTWEFDGKTWIRIETPNSPPSRFWHGMAYESRRNVTIVFGGERSTSTSNLLNDTWEYDGKDWVKINTAHSPLPRGYGALLAYDSCRGKTVLFGGKDSRGLPTETWEYDGKDWTQVQTSASPPGRWLSAMAFDSTRCKMVLFGGGDGKDDTWEYDGKNWSRISTGNTPPARWAHALAFNPVTSHIILFGGYNPKTQHPMNDTWAYDGTNWQILSTTPSPSTREQHAMAFYGVTSQVIVISGWGSDGNWVLTEGVTQPAACGAGWSRLSIGKYAIVMPGDPNRVRSEPQKGNNLLTALNAGAIVKIIEGPVCADGLVFWKVSNASIPGGFGWTAEGDGTEYWMVPYQP